jgi:ankyrin repeat protein
MKNSYEPLLGRSTSETPGIHTAARLGDLEAVIRELESGADIYSRDPNGNTPLHLAAFNGHREVAQKLLERGTDVNVRLSGDLVNLWSPLHMAAENDQAEMARLLIEWNADLNVEDQYGTTPLMLSVDEMISPDVAVLLIQSGADVSKALDIAKSFARSEEGAYIIRLMKEIS